MRPLIGFSIVAILVTGCASAAALPSTGPAVPSAVGSVAPSSAASVVPSAPASAAAAGPSVKGPDPSAVPPPAPLAVTWSQTPAMGFGVGTTTMTITWKDSGAAGVTIRVYGVTACLNPPGTDNVPCLAQSTKLPADVLTLVATAPAAQGEVSWTWPSWGNIGQALAVHGSETYYAFVVEASAAAGPSKAIVAATAEACSTCTT